MASAAKKKNEPEVRPIIVKKIIEDGHGGHHGGAWKVAYADFVTAMMAFFLLMWILGQTDAQKRKGLADYFTPTIVELKQNSAGSNGIMGGDSIVGADNYPNRAAQTGTKAITIPRDVVGGPDSGGGKERDMERFERLKKTLVQRMEASAALKKLKAQVRFTDTREGLRIDLIDEANFSMFAVGTDKLLPQARTLLGEVAQVIAGVPNEIIVRGHTDALPYSSGGMNNWLLSGARAEATRAALHSSGVPGGRFARIEGVAEREPYVPADRYDPRNRRMSITLAWAKGDPAPTAAANRIKASLPARAKSEDR
ncbi:flagellar motor protein MotB [Allosphingosinicella vermicomposti]|uniref:flagellar motor protein MotB n=1 Tax=Allosphingosinicella vermicomposti TaxID=614671 RepID=UPI000D0FF037|nr:flagellar motor protein MotB [Allosphingosinicella vermicomposti]